MKSVEPIVKEMSHDYYLRKQIGGSVTTRQFEVYQERCKKAIRG